ncbi:retinitis pigmentosa 1-like 1 protein [Denticeps clupeoides]|uniref:Uncharacterized protein n=1 Tax=Denticeps clupeoides TaxID=299321 RepID=A0AAY4EH29_9TELE|nr:retinitis pigmentosa 1-like 1 protein [Denticeps clupeoides]XP_028817860.1 retinitis pigmentosa 1-like 1 protein [Denticeps clupeoides]XP_028817861.1 retinitis pigmentosa 1-like 1 protein [Denticeps clupeoides]
MAATEACAGVVQGDNVETKAEVEPANAEPSQAPAEETQEPANEAPQSTEQQPDGKAKPASEKIWDSFLNKSGLGKVMGGRKKKDHSTGAEDPVGEGDQDKKPTDQAEDNKEHISNQTPEGGEAGAEDQAVEQAPENQEGSQEQKTSVSSKDAKPKHGEKTSVRDFIRKPVARIFSHRSTEKKDGTGEARKPGPVRSRSLDRLEDPDASTVVVDQLEDAQEAGAEPDKSHATKHMKRWHSFKKLMAQKSHKKTDESKDGEGVEIGEGAGDASTLDSAAKPDYSGQKRWKLKRSWTFQGLKRDLSVPAIHKPKDGEKDTAERGEESASEVAEGAAAPSEEAKATAEGDAQEKPAAEGDEEKEAAGAPQRVKSVDQHANEIWTSFKKRVIPKAKKSTDASGGGGEEGGEAAGEQDQTDEQQAGKDPAKTAKAKRTHFNRAVSLKNFILRKGKSASVDLGEGSAAQKEDDDDGGGTGDAKDTDSPAEAAGAAAVPQGESEDQAVPLSSDKDEAQVAGEHEAADGEESHKSTPSGQQANPAAAEEATGAPPAETKTNGENGCMDAVEHNHEAPDGETGDGAKQEPVDSSEKAKDGKILSQDGKCGNAVAQSEKQAGNV